MKKTIVYIVMLLLLGFGVYYFIFKEHDAFAGSEAGFTIKDTSAIGKIFMADKKGQTILLERKPNGWILNGKYPVMPSPLNTLMETLLRQTAAFPVPQQAYNTAITVLAGTAVKVEVYDKAGDKIRVFYVGGQANDNAGSYMLMEGAQTPYVVQIPGFPGYLTPRYSTDITDWRDRTVFNVPAAQIASVSVQYPQEPLNSFVMKAGKDGKLTVDVDPVLSNGKTVNSRRAEVFSKFFERVYCEGYINGVYKLDSIIKSTEKRCDIELITKDGAKQQVAVYWMPLNRRSKNMLKPVPGVDDKYDADRYYAVINQAKDTVIIQFGTFDKIFRKAWEFYTPDDTTANRTVQISR